MFLISHSCSPFLTYTIYTYILRLCTFLLVNLWHLLALTFITSALFALFLCHKYKIPVRGNIPESERVF